MDNTVRWTTGRERKLNWAIIGASGFVGSGIIDALEDLKTSNVMPVKAPRLHTPSMVDEQSILNAVRRDPVLHDVVNGLTASLKGIDVVVNAAGIAAPDAVETDALTGANALLPVVVAEAAKFAGVGKFIHISSAAVQGSKEVLDESPAVAPFSAYSRSKALGERALALLNETHSDELCVTTIRATSVQGPGRETTNALKKVARSRLASVSMPGDQPSVVSSLSGLSQFVVKVGIYAGVLPPLLIQPWEGASARDVIQLAGKGRTPLMIPEPIARSGVISLRLLGVLNHRFKALARRLEVMWFGQRQVAGWAVETGLVEQNMTGPADTLRMALSS